MTSGSPMNPSMTPFSMLMYMSGMLMPTTVMPSARARSRAMPPPGTPSLSPRRSSSLVIFLLVPMHTPTGMPSVSRYLVPSQSLAAASGKAFSMASAMAAGSSRERLGLTML